MPCLQRGAAQCGGGTSSQGWAAQHRAATHATRRCAVGSKLTFSKMPPGKNWNLLKPKTKKSETHPRHAHSHVRVARARVKGLIQKVPGWDLFLWCKARAEIFCVSIIDEPMTPKGRAASVERAAT